MNTNVRNELKKIVSQIETLAHETHARLSAGGGILDVANELVKNTITLTFGLGELYASEKDPVVVKAQVVTPVKRTQSNWHNVRDNRGRFTRVMLP